MRDAPAAFGGFRAGEGGKTAVEILAHMGDLFDWALTMADGAAVWKDAAPLPWDGEVARFFAALERFDARLARGAPLAQPATKIFQGPVADALDAHGAARDAAPDVGREDEGRELLRCRHRRRPRRTRTGGAAARVRLSQAGIQSVNVAPGPSLFATSSRPRCACRTFWTTVRPRPVPGTVSDPWNLR